MTCGPCSDRAIYLIGEPPYIPTQSYDAGDYVVEAGILYVSLEDENQGNNPQESDAWERTTILEQLIELRALSVSGTLENLGYVEFVGGGTVYPKGTGVRNNGKLCIANVTTDNVPPADAGTWVSDPVTYEFWNVFDTFQAYQKFLLNP